ncbi:MAG: DapH/DapD/GlmU-related protein [Anaerolineae bacterium]
MLKKILKNLRFTLLRLTKYRTVIFGRDVYIGKGTHIRPHSTTFGDNVSIGHYCRFEARHIEVGNFVMMAAHVGIIDRDAHDARTVGKPFIETGPEVGQPVIIESDVWIGFGAIILSGVTVGRGSIIAAGSIIVDDVPPYSIAASAKATVIAQRFDAKTSQEHEATLRAYYDQCYR